MAIEVPRNAFLDASSGNDCMCARGFEKSGSSCVEIDVLANAHLDYSGNCWECNRGYEARGLECMAHNARG
jgi:hypothetical protein